MMVFATAMPYAQEHSVTRNIDGTFSVEGSVEQGKKLVKILEKTITDIASCGDAPQFELFDGTGCVDPEVDPVVEDHAKALIPSCPASDEVPAWDGTSWMCKQLSGVIVDCVVNRTVSGGCSINFGQVNHGTSDSDYCSLGGDRGCYSTVSCNMGAQSFSSEQCFNSDWVVGSWNIPCYDTDPSPLNEVWEWDRSVTCPVAGDCDMSRRPATTGACGSIPQNGLCGVATNNCAAGTFSDIPDTAFDENWTCLGINSGLDASCSNPISATAIDGICGVTTNSCITGNFIDTADTAANYMWHCMGSGGGVDALNCSRPIAGPPPSDCFDSLSTAGCTSFNAISHGASNSWSCDAGYTGSCSAECDSGTFINTSNTCAAVPDCPSTTINRNETVSGLGIRSCAFNLPSGNAGDVVNNSSNAGSCDWQAGGDIDCFGTFTCNGSSWTTNSWSATCISGSVDGACATTLNSCNAGINVDISDSPTHFIWECLGHNGGTDDSCSIPKPPATFSWSIDSSYGNCSVTCGSGVRTRAVTCRQDSDSTVVGDGNCTDPKPADSQACVTDTTCVWEHQGDAEVGNSGNCPFDGDSCAGSGYYTLRVCCGPHGVPTGPHSCRHNTNPLAVIDPVYYPCK